MKATELRIRNIIESGVIARMDIAEGVLFDMDVITFQNQRRKISNPSPEPLTEDWLLKFGFVQFTKSTDPFLFRMSLDTQRQMRFDSEGFSIETKMSGWIWRMPEIKFVHQLQNLYFALTGEELTIKQRENVHS